MEMPQSYTTDQPIYTCMQNQTVREPLYFMKSKSISGVTSTCSNTFKTPIGHRGDNRWRPHPILFGFSLSVKAAPHGCVIRTGQP